MQVLRVVMALAAAVILAGCLPVTTKTPVGTTAGLKTDPALYGSWIGYPPKDKDSPAVFFHFYKGKADTMSAAMVQATGAKDDGVTLFDITTAKVGQHHFINAAIVSDKDPSGTFPVLYVLQGRSLTLYLIDEDKARAAVKAGTIKGTVEPGNGGDVVVTADAEELDAFMAKPEAKTLFRLLIALKKVE